jgi:phospholipase C
VSSREPDRRAFLRFATKSLGTAGAIAALPESIQKALAIPAASPTGTIEDVKHIVIFMQENRSFDHYYGTMAGVRGFGDRVTIPLPGGRSVWQQPDLKTGTDILPFHLDTAKTRAQCIISLDHGWTTGHAAWNNGKYDRWIEQKTPLTMGYYQEADIPFQFVLANAFTICDAYFCSVMSATDPNRVYHWTGSVKPPGYKGGALIDNDLVERNVADWTTCPERLEKAGISWRVYQKSVGDDSKHPFDGNYGDNPLAFFLQYIHSPEDSKLRREALSSHPIEELARDVQNGTLPQVSWIVSPEAYSEHPAWPPAYGAQYTAQVLEALTSNPDVWSKTVLFINYDENDGFFDHVVPPTPPVSHRHGHSTVDASDELYLDPKLGVMPLGLGVRVPMTIVSPWTRGGWVCSQVFDHTSVLRFLEARFGESMRETHITKWRRTVCGDLTSAFDFARPNASWPQLPDTASYREETDRACQRLPDPAVPERGQFPLQQPGTRPARAVPYRMHADGRIDRENNRLWVDFTNEGGGAVFHAYAPEHPQSPWVYTIESKKEYSAFWLLNGSEGICDKAGKYCLSVHGPNGFLRQFSGSAVGPEADISVSARFDQVDGRLHLELHNMSRQPSVVTVRDNAYGQSMRRYQLQADSKIADVWDLAANGRWYDLSVSHDQDRHFSRRLAGHVENGLPSTSDPALRTS